MRSKQSFQVRKWLLSMFPEEVRLLQVSKCRYVNLKNTTHQLKLMGMGEWRCSKKGGIGDAYTRVTRIR